MKQVTTKYQFDIKKHVGTSFSDAQIKNYTYRATRLTDDVPVQLVMFTSSKPGQIASYYKKLAKLAEIKHRCLTPILQCIQDLQNNQLFLILEWNDGFSFGECLTRDTFLDWQLAVSMIKDIYEGLSQIHKAGVTHSFVNIENVQIFQGRARLSFRNLIYKTYYLAPQIKQNHQKTKQSDLFSLGVCLYKFLFGVLPFRQKSKQQYVKNVKAGLPRKMDIPNCSFSKFIPEHVQQCFNCLCHYKSSERLKSIPLLQQIKLPKFRYDQTLVTQSLGESYHFLRVRQAYQEQLRITVASIKQSKIFQMDIISHNLTELSTYVDDVIQPFKSAANNYFANIREFYAPLKNSLAIVYDYCAQGELKQYRRNKRFDAVMIAEVSGFMRNVLSHWQGQYRFLTNQQILVKKGKPVLKFPPFPTKQFKEKLKLAKQGNYFIAAEVEAGIQSLTADSWSVGVIEYWMNFDGLPTFDGQNKVVIKDASELSIQKIKELTELIHKKHLQRKNLFPESIKPKQDRKISTDSVSSSQSPRMNSKIKTTRSKRADTMEIKMLEEQSQNIEQENDLELLQYNLTETKQQQGDTKRMKRKNRRGGLDKNNNKANDSQEIQEDQFQKQFRKQSGNEKDVAKVKKRTVTFDDGVGLQDGQKKNRVSSYQANSQIQNENILNTNSTPIIKKSKSSVQHADKGKSLSKKDSLGSRNGQQIANMNNESYNRLNSLNDQIEDSKMDKIIVKKNNRFPSFSGIIGQPNKSSRRDSLEKSKKDGKTQIKSSKDRRNTQTNLPIQELDMSDKLVKSIANQAWKMSIVEKHWTKPIRIVLKGLITCLIYFFFFYFTFLTTTGDLLKTRYDFTTQIIYLRSDQLATTPTINFTMVTRTPYQSYNQLNNQTLTYVRDVVKCVTNDYSVGSNIVQIINSSSFGSYEVFGIIIVVVNFILLLVALAKLDLPKALSLTQFDDHFYVPIYSWLLINMAEASLTSCTYLIYGGMFDLQLDPCLSRSNFPSLTFILKRLTASFSWRFVWVYIGIVLAYGLIIYLIIRPKVRMPQYLYIIWFLLYLAGVGARGLGTYAFSKQGIMGACGQLLSLIAGFPLIMIDLFFSCKLRKIEKPSHQIQSAKDPSQNANNITEQNLIQKV